MLKKYRVIIFAILGAVLILASSVTPVLAVTRSDADVVPEKNYSFRVEIEGVYIGPVETVEGLGISQDVIEYQNGDDPLTRKRPGRVAYSAITLTKQYTATSTLNDWIETARCGNGDYERRNMSIILLDSKNNEIKRWNCFQCFPESWSLSPLDASADELLTEELVIVIEYFEEA